MDSLINKVHTVWDTGFKHRTYACKLIHALRHIRRQSPTAAPPTRAVRAAADRTLAIAAKGTTRWSRAILSTRSHLRLTRKPRSTQAARDRIRKLINLRQARSKKKSGLDVRVRTLGRLVPGCQKMPFPVILDEAMDYIAALEMQVKAMRAIAELLSQAAPSEVARLDRAAPSSVATTIE